MQGPPWATLLLINQAEWRMILLICLLLRMSWIMNPGRGCPLTLRISQNRGCYLLLCKLRAQSLMRLLRIIMWRFVLKLEEASSLPRLDVCLMKKMA